MSELEKVFTLNVCFATSVVWGVYERSQGIKITDQVVLAFIFGIAIIIRCFKK